MPLQKDSPEMRAAKEIIRGKERSHAKLEELYDLVDKATGQDRKNVGQMIEAFYASWDTFPEDGERRELWL